MKAKSLQDLSAIRKTVADKAKAAAEAEAARLEAERRAEAERNLFTRAIGQVQPIAAKPRVQVNIPAPVPRRLQQDIDDAAALQESMSDEFDVSTLLDVDDQMSFRRPGIGTDVTRKLRKGEWSIQGQIDLHGLRSDEARNAVGQFIRDAKRMGWRCVRVVHGKGLGSPGKEPVLKSKVQRWLVQKNEVLAFVQAKPSDGGAGALVVLLGPANG
ncbi:MAG: DNA mismatch repair protein MutS [Betaproteobacteria bacterium]|nr:DNA mismatch repair protein MutS [Betaproteobacteria bacterium]